VSLRLGRGARATRRRSGGGGPRSLAANQTLGSVAQSLAATGGGGGAGTPANTAAPVILGDLSNSGFISCRTNGTWTNSPTGYSYQWKRDTTNVGVNANTYRKSPADNGATITCVVTASNGLGAGTAASSNSIGPISSASLDIAQPSTTKVPTYVGTTVTPSANTAAALEAACVTLNNNGGGTLDLRGFSTYTVGRQVAGLNGLYYDGVPSINIQNCTSKVVVDVRGCTFTTSASLWFGAFDPDHSGTPIDITTFAAGAYPHPPIAYAAQIGPVISITGNVDVEIWGSGSVSLVGAGATLFDGNVSNLTIGGLWHAAGDGGRALQHYGIVEDNNGSFQILNGATGKHFATDALGMKWTNLTGALPKKTKYVENFDAIENGRLGWSWVGGNHCNMVWCRSLRNSMVAYTNGIQSVPSSGMDIENETSFTSQDPFSLYNGTFTRCTFSDNFGCGVISASGQSRQAMTWNYCTLDAGHGQTSMVPDARYWVLNHCLLIGAFNGLITQADMTGNGGQGIADEALIAYDTTFDVHASASLAGLTHEFGDTGSSAGVNTFAVTPQVSLGGPWAQMIRCTFNIDQYLLDPPQNANTVTYIDCTINGFQSGAPIWGIFGGTCQFVYTNPVPGYGTVHQNVTNIVRLPGLVLKENGTTI
jgi:hypothetical protein